MMERRLNNKQVFLTGSEATQHKPFAFFYLKSHETRVSMWQSAELE